MTLPKLCCPALWGLVVTKTMKCGWLGLKWTVVIKKNKKQKANSLGSKDVTLKERMQDTHHSSLKRYVEMLKSEYELYDTPP